MSRPLHRGSSGARISGGGSQDLWDSQMKDRSEKEDLSKRDSSDLSYPPLKFPSQLLSSNSPAKFTNLENGFASDPCSASSPRKRHHLIMLALRSSLFLIVILAVTGSLWWTISISTSSRGHINQHYKDLHARVLSDLWDIGELSLGPTKLRELEACPDEFENYVPCYNVSENVALGYSDGNEFERHCGHSVKQHCLVVPPTNYKIPLRWPTGKDIIWVANVKITAQQVLSSGSLTKRMMMLEEEQISFRSASLMFDGVEDYAQQIAKMIGLSNEYELTKAGVRTILDIGCGYGSFGAHLFSKQLLTMCIAHHETSGSQVQLTLERGLPAMISSFNSTQLPYPALSFDMLHCLRCGIDWDQKDGKYLLEADRVLKPGGYFVWTSPITNAHGNSRIKVHKKRWKFIHDFAESLCWELLSQQDETVVWKKTSKTSCYGSRNPGLGPPICSKAQDVESPSNRPLQGCIGGIRSKRWIPIEEKTTWPSRANLNVTELKLYGLHPEDLSEDIDNWRAAVREYWSLLSPLIFSDHPKRPGDEDPSPPYNMVRNVLDMNAHFGGFNAALLEAGKFVWVMNVVPTGAPNYLSMILDRGLVGVRHDWCEGFPTYPRTYDMVHASGLLSLENNQNRRCSMLDLFAEIDRILRPEGWVIIRDTAAFIDSARALSTRFKWDARVIGVESNTDERLLICQKPFLKKPSS
ncbi:probable pectin methyltransferase QUA2 [Rhodamnia argentea]|uniref:Methyltransferase n=1 Tax=Rhodamnia argentea TaxID=178133 RepID=A0A8B8Q8J8_9MYRT|nr:probable pectin methyltransferase QUA2 [Rhodamnia argentea]